MVVSLPRTLLGKLHAGVFFHTNKLAFMCTGAKQVGGGQKVKTKWVQRPSPPSGTLSLTTDDGGDDHAAYPHRQ